MCGPDWNAQRVRPLSSDDRKLYIRHERAPRTMIDFAQPAAISVFKPFARQNVVCPSVMRNTFAGKYQYMRAETRDP